MTNISTAVSLQQLDSRNLSGYKVRLLFKRDMFLITKTIVLFKKKKVYLWRNGSCDVACINLYQPQPVSGKKQAASVDSMTLKAVVAPNDYTAATAVRCSYTILSHGPSVCGPCVLLGRDLVLFVSQCFESNTEADPSQAANIHSACIRCVRLESSWEVKIRTGSGYNSLLGSDGNMLPTPHSSLQRFRSLSKRMCTHISLSYTHLWRWIYTTRPMSLRTSGPWKFDTGSGGKSCRHMSVHLSRVERKADKTLSGPGRCGPHSCIFGWRARETGDRIKCR